MISPKYINKKIGAVKILYIVFLFLKMFHSKSNISQFSGKVLNLIFLKDTIKSCSILAAVLQEALHSNLYANAVYLLASYLDPSPWPVVLMKCIILCVKQHNFLFVQPIFQLWFETCHFQKLRN